MRLSSEAIQLIGISVAILLLYFTTPICWSDYYRGDNAIEPAHLCQNFNVIISRPSLLTWSVSENDGDYCITAIQGKSGL